MAGEPLAWSLVTQAAWVVPVALLAALAAKAVGQPRIVGALVAGLLLGPAVLGQVAPNLHQRLVTGGYEEHRSLRQYLSDQNELLVKLRSRGFDVEASKDFQAQAVKGLHLRQRAYDEAIALRDRSHALLTLFAAAALALAGGFLLAGPKPAALLGDAGATATGAAVIVVLFSAAAVSLLDHWLTGPEALVGGWALTAIALAAGLPIHAAIAAAGPDDDTPALHAATNRWLILGAWTAAAALIAAYGRPVHAVGVGVFTVCVTTIGLPVAHLLQRKMADAAARDALSLVLIAVLAAVGAAALNVHPLAALAIAALACPIVADTDAPLARRLAELAAPIVALLVVLRIDPVQHFNPWLLLAALVVLGDGKAIGAWIAARFWARRDGEEALHAGASVFAGGAVLLTIAWLLHLRGIIDAPVYTAVVLAELILMIFYRPVLAMAAALRETEQTPA